MEDTTEMSLNANCRLQTYQDEAHGEVLPITTYAFQNFKNYRP